MSSRKHGIRITSALTLSLLTMSTLGASLTETRQTELQHLLRHDCGSCHGMTLNGGLGPALSYDALADKPKIYLENTIRDGHPGTPMPPWGALLSPTDIDYLVELLTSDASQQ